jgi:hypothetical protein
MDIEFTYYRNVTWRSGSKARYWRLQSRMSPPSFLKRLTFWNFDNPRGRRRFQTQAVLVRLSSIKTIISPMQSLSSESVCRSMMSSAELAKLSAIDVCGEEIKLRLSADIVESSISGDSGLVLQGVRKSTKSSSAAAGSWWRVSGAKCKLREQGGERTHQALLESWMGGLCGG